MIYIVLKTYCRPETVHSEVYTRSIRCLPAKVKRDCKAGVLYFNLVLFTLGQAVLFDVVWSLIHTSFWEYVKVSEFYVRFNVIFIDRVLKNSERI